MTDRASLIQKVARKLGAQVGTVGTNTATTAILNGLINTTGDDQAFVNQRLIFPLAPDEASKQTLITAWSDLIGRATFATRTAFGADETYILTNRADYTLSEYREALAFALGKSKRSYRRVIPAIQGERYYNLADLDWLEGAGDVDAVYVSNSPIMLHNEDFSLWQNGPNAAPDGYGFDGPTVQRITGGVRSPFQTYIATTDSVARLTQTIPASLTQWITRGSNPTFTPIQAGAWVETQSVNGVRLFIFDGTDYHYSDYVTADNVPQFPTVSLTPTAEMTALQWGILLEAGASARVSWAGLMQASQPFQDAVKNYGSGAYVEYETPFNARNVGGRPVIELQQPANGQVVVYCRRKFAQVTTDDAYIDDEYERVLEAGLAVFLLGNVKQGVDRTRYDRVLAEELSIWVRFLANTTDLPVPQPLTQIQIGPA